jgi:hypothetical protein
MNMWKFPETRGNYEADSDIKKFGKLLMIGATGNSCTQLKEDFDRLADAVEKRFSQEQLKQLGLEIYSVATDTLLMAAVGLWPPTPDFDIDQPALNANMDNLLKKLGME